MKILVLSDTHVPRAAVDLPGEIYRRIEEADLVLHAGDFVEIGVLEKLRKLKETIGVCGNMDSEEIRKVLKPKEVVTIGKVKIGLIHGYGPPNILPETVQTEFGKVNAIVFGHSHIPMNVVDNKILLFNPGSPTDKIFAMRHSYGMLDVDDGKIEGKIVRLED